MTQRLILFIIYISITLPLHCMDFGLRFNSHSFPPDKRTTLTVGREDFPVDKDFKLGFFFNFYDNPIFGNIATLKTDDGQRVSLVASSIETDNFRLALAVNDSLYHHKTPLTLDPTKEDHIDLILDKTHNLVSVSLNNIELEAAMDLSKTESVKATFGMDTEAGMPDNAPIELRNIRIFLNGRNTNHWDLKYHDTDTTSIDDINGIEAVVTNPHWLIDDHSELKKVFSIDTSDRIQTTYDPVRNLFYIVGDHSLITLDPLSGDTASTPIKGGERVMAYSNHSYYHPASRRIINYNLTDKRTVWLDMADRSWKGFSAGADAEPHFSNHAVAIEGDTLYAFGGYGFYRYHNDFFTVNLADGTVTTHSLSPDLIPTTSAAAAANEGKLYLFGGKGNDSGRQELPSRYQYALYEYDLSTWKGRKLWEMDSVGYDFLPGQTMYLDKADDCFYAASTGHGGELLRISKSSPQIDVVSTPVHTKMDYHDLVLDLFRSDDGRYYYMVMDKRPDAVNHELSIYTVTPPFLKDIAVITQRESTPYPSATTPSIFSYPIVRIFLIICILFLIASAGAAFAIIGIRRKRRNPPTASIADEPLPPRPAQEALSGEDIPLSIRENLNLRFAETDPTSTPIFDRTRGCISLLGGFSVRDKEGADVTPKFTGRLKQLLIMLLLSSQKYEDGIRYQTIDEEIWGDKDEKAAQNNRNVSMRKLRMLLEEVGDGAIIYDKGHYTLATGNIMSDYEKLRNRMKETDNVSLERVNEIVELLLMGPLLPDTNYEWLDGYKAEFSNSALELLLTLLKRELPDNPGLAYRIAETISLHDSLNEEALIAKCRILAMRGMPGLAKKIHARFCKEYLDSLDVEYPLSFAEICK